MILRGNPQYVFFSIQDIFFMYKYVSLGCYSSIGFLKHFVADDVCNIETCRTNEKISYGNS